MECHICKKVYSLALVLVLVVIVELTTVLPVFLYLTKQPRGNVKGCVNPKKSFRYFDGKKIVNKLATFSEEES